MVTGAVILAVVLMSFRPTLTIQNGTRGFRHRSLARYPAYWEGVSSLMGPLGISYLMALKLKREEFIGNISLIYLAGAIPLYGSLAA